MRDFLEVPERLFNGDESCPKTGKVLAPKGWKNLDIIKKGNEKENITVLICFSASGKICPETWVLGKSDSGWMTSDVFFEIIS